MLDSLFDLSQILLTIFLSERRTFLIKCISRSNHQMFVNIKVFCYPVVPDSKKIPICTGYQKYTHCYPVVPDSNGYSFREKILRSH